MSLVVVEASLAEVTVGQGILQEVSSVELVPCVFNLTKRKSELADSYRHNMGKYVYVQGVIVQYST